MKPAEIFRNNVNALIEKKKLKQVRIAEAIGEDSQGLNGYLRGRIGWSEEKRLKLAVYLEMDYHELCNPEFIVEIKEGIGFHDEVQAELIKSDKHIARDYISRLIEKTGDPSEEVAKEALEELKKISEALQQSDTEETDLKLIHNKFPGGTLGFPEGKERTEQPAHIDPLVLKLVIEGVENHLTEIHKSLTPDLKSRLIALLYDHYAETGEPVNKRKIAHYLKLVA
jgi:transcriptional regulator with XRE-family HTH domain